MRTSIFLACVLILSGQAFSQTKKAFEPTQVKFVIKNAGLKVDGSIGGFEGFVMIDTQSLTASKIEGTLDPSTIKTGINLRDNHLKKRDYFNVKEFPKITMTSTQIKKTSRRRYTGSFDLTIKDVYKKRVHSLYYF